MKYTYFNLVDVENLIKTKQWKDEAGNVHCTDCDYVSKYTTNSDEKRFQGSTVWLVNVFSNISDLLDYPSSRLIDWNKIIKMLPVDVDASFGKHEEPKIHVSGHSEQLCHL